MVKEYRLTPKHWECVERYVKLLVPMIYAHPTWRGDRYKSCRIIAPSEMRADFLEMVKTGIIQRITHIEKVKRRAR